MLQDPAHRHSMHCGYYARMAWPPLYYKKSTELLLYGNYVTPPAPGGASVDMHCSASVSVNSHCLVLCNGINQRISRSQHLPKQIMRFMYSRQGIDLIMPVTICASLYVLLTVVLKHKSMLQPIRCCNVVYHYHSQRCWQCQCHHRQYHPMHFSVLHVPPTV